MVSRHERGIGRKAKADGILASVPVQIRQRLQTYDQQQVLQHWNDLTDRERQSLVSQLTQIDFHRLRRLVAEGARHEDWDAVAARAEPPPAVRRDRPGDSAARRTARRLGEEALSEGRVGAILVAGGQGTRLGFPHPKGIFPIGPVSRASLFQIHFERLRAVAGRFGSSMALYLMTSPATHDETIRYLNDHQRFGYPDQDLVVFCQGVMPAVDAATGKILLESPGRIAFSPDGHGGVVAALQKSGAVEDMQRRGVRELFYFQVDNPLAPVCDPEVIGHHIHSGSEISTLAVAKDSPHDRLGNIVRVDGRVRIIEYINMPDEAARKKAADGGLLFWAGNTGVHVFNTAFLKQMSQSDTSLPFHASRKRVPFVDSRAQRIEPDQPNALKFERFVFDLMPAARESIVIEVDRHATFAPLKNADDQSRDTPSSVREQMMHVHRAWLRSAGARIDDDVVVEISPLYATSETELREKLAPGTAIGKSIYLRDQ